MRLKAAVAILSLITAHCVLSEDHKVTDRVYLEIQHGDKYLGRIVIGLFGEVVPKTVHNFKTIAAVGIDGRTYGHSTFHRVIPRFMIQGGDIINGDGTFTDSIYGGLFEDENFILKHNFAGFVSMANSGPDTNGCQFFITTIATPWLDGKHVVFGKVLEGQHIVHQIEHVKADSDDIPLEPVNIVQSGILETTEPFYISSETFEYSLWQWIKAGCIPLSFSFLILAFFHWVICKLDGFKLI